MTHTCTHAHTHKDTHFFFSVCVVCFIASLNYASLLCFMDVINLYIAFILMRAQLWPAYTPKHTQLHSHMCICEITLKHIYSIDLLLFAIWICRNFFTIFLAFNSIQFFFYFFYLLHLLHLKMDNILLVQHLHFYAIPEIIYTIYIPYAIRSQRQILWLHFD